MPGGGAGKLLGYLSRLKAARAGRIVAKGVRRALPVGKQSGLLKSGRLFAKSQAKGGNVPRTVKLAKRYLGEAAVHGVVAAGLGTAGAATVVRRVRRAGLQRAERKKR